MPNGNISTSSYKKCRKKIKSQLNRACVVPAAVGGGTPPVARRGRVDRPCTGEKTHALLDLLDNYNSDLSDIEVVEYSEEDDYSNDSSDEENHMGRSFRTKQRGFIGPRALSLSPKASRPTKTKFIVKKTNKKENCDSQIPGRSITSNKPTTRSTPSGITAQWINQRKNTNCTPTLAANSPASTPTQAPPTDLTTPSTISTPSEIQAQWINQCKNTNATPTSGANSTTSTPTQAP